MLKKSSYKRLILTGLLAPAILSAQAMTVQAEETTEQPTQVQQPAPTSAPAVSPAPATTAPGTADVPATPTPTQPQQTDTSAAPVATPAPTNTPAPTETPAPTAGTPTAPAPNPAPQTPDAPTQGTPTAPNTGTPVTPTAPVRNPNPTITIGDQVVPVSYDKPTVAPVKQSNVPDRIASTLTKYPATEISLNWYTKDALPSASVQLSESPDMSNAKTFMATTIATTTEYVQRTESGAIIYQISDLNKDKTNVVAYFTDDLIKKDNKTWTYGSTNGYEIYTPVSETINRVTISGLKPNTRYYYKVGTPTLSSAVGTFKTAAADQSEFKFIHYTDTQNAIWNENVRNEAEFGANTLNEAIHTAKNPAFALHTGDVVEISRVEDEWRDVMNRAQESYLKVPHVVSSGNHDAHKTSLNDHFNIPVTNEIAKGSYYSFDYNGAHFAVVNTNDNDKDDDNQNGAAISDTQLAWLEKDLEDARKRGVNWIVVSYHKPLYSSSYHSLQDTDVQAVRERLITILDKYDVDLVLNGHDHVLTATKPLVANIDAFADGVVDVTTRRLKDSQGREYIDTDGTMFVIPNAAGTKLYDDIFNESLEHIKKVRPRLSFMTQENLEDYRKLFALSAQPGYSEKFKSSHSNQRDSKWQNFGVYTVTPDELKIDLYQVEGDVLGQPENALRGAKLVASYVLVNHKFDLAEKNRELKEAELALDQSDDDDDDDKSNQKAKPAGRTSQKVVAQQLANQKSSKTVAAAKATNKEKTLPNTGSVENSTLPTLGAALIGLMALLFRKKRD